MAKDKIFFFTKVMSYLVQEWDRNWETNISQTARNIFIVNIQLGGFGKNNSTCLIGSIAENSAGEAIQITVNSTLMISDKIPKATIKNNLFAKVRIWQWA